MAFGRKWAAERPRRSLLHSAAEGTGNISPSSFGRSRSSAPQQHQLLLAVKGFDGEGRGPTIGYLAERLQVRHHSVVELVNRLETHMVQRRAGERDRRQVIVALSDAGEQILKGLAAQHVTEIQQIGRGLVEALQQVLEGESDAGAGSRERT